MNNEEEKALEVLKTVIEARKFSGIFSSIDIIFEAIETILKLYEDKKEEIYAIAKTNYTVGVLEERNEWYKKINEKIEILEKLQKEFPNNEEIRIKIIALKELIGKEE